MTDFISSSCIEIAQIDSNLRGYWEFGVNHIIDKKC